MSSPNNQSNILQGSVNKDILLKLKGKRTIKGKLKSFDQYMNLTLENATEVLEGDKVQQMGEIFIKGENIVIIATDWLYEWQIFLIIIITKFFQKKLS